MYLALSAAITLSCLILTANIYRGMVSVKESGERGGGEEQRRERREREEKVSLTFYVVFF